MTRAGARMRTLATRLRAFIAITAALLLSEPAANAQDSPSSEQQGQANVEIGAAISVFPIGGPAGVGLRVGGGNGGRFSVEGQLDWMEAFDTRRQIDDLIWFYFWQVKHRLGSDAGPSSVFATYGTAGWASWTSSRRGREPAWLFPPIVPIVGLGWQQVTARHTAVRLDVQFLIGAFEGAAVMPRIGAGIFIPVRRYTGGR